MSLKTGTCLGLGLGLGLVSIWLQFETHKGTSHDSLIETIALTGEVESTDVIQDCKGVDPRYFSWKGAAILCREACCSTLWISKKEWTLQGIRVLRDRTPFIM